MARAASRRSTEKRTADPSPARWSHGTFHWNELRTRDAERAKTFDGKQQKASA